jgi:toxin-antitoxin system PIN domain toxin
MSQYLLDVNVLLALAWPPHRSHAIARDWFDKNAHNGWATCALTEAAFVRIASNPAFTPGGVTLPEALKALDAFSDSRFHCFWADEISFADAVRPFRQRLVGHRQVSDAHLLGLAMHKRGKLATLDQGILSLLPEGSPGREHVELIGATIP